MNKNIIPVVFLFFMSNAQALPENFVYLNKVDPSIIQAMKYITNNNFIGRPIQGYQAAKCILTAPAASALKKAQQELKKKSLSLEVYDCYRPQRAVKDFISWGNDSTDQKNKSDYYPSISKKDLFTLGYVGTKSGHTRGSTVDLTIVSLKSGEELDMGTHFDFMDESSHTLSEKIQGQQRENRLLLRNTMLNAGFLPYENEWWHFGLNNEPYPESFFDTHPRFDFPVK